MSLRQPLSSRRCNCRRARRAPWQILVRRVTLVVRVGTAILNSSRDHCRGIVRRAARKFKFHVEGVLARGRRAEKPPFARVLPRPTHQTSRCDAGVNRDERQTIDTTPPRGVTAVVVHGARRGVVAMANRRTPRSPQVRACHVPQPHVRTDDIKRASSRSWRSATAFGGSASRRRRVTRRARRRGGPQRSRSWSLSWSRSRS